MILGLEIGEFQLHRCRLLLVHVVDPDFGKIGRNDPAGFLIKRKSVVIFFGLLIRCLSLMARLRLIQGNAKTLLLDQDTGLGNIHVDALNIAIFSDNLFLKIQTIRDMIDAHDLLKDLDPEGSGILVFPAFVFPLIVKLTRSFPLLSICHVPFTPLLCKPVICTEVYQKPSFSSTIVMMQLLNHCRGSLLYECPSVSYLFRMIFRI